MINSIFRFLIIISFLFLSSFLYSQSESVGIKDKNLSNSLPIQEDRALEMVLSHTRVAKGAPFHVDLYFKTNDSKQVSYYYPKNLSFAKVQRSPVFRIYHYQNHLYRVRFYYIATKTGYFYLDGFRVKTKEAVYKGIANNIEIGVWKGGTIVMPLVAQWRLMAKGIYPNQNFIAQLVVVDYPFEKIIVQDIAFDNISEFSFDPIEFQPESKSRNILNQQLNSMIVKAYLVSPNDSGPFKLPSGTIYTEKKLKIAIIEKKLPYIGLEVQTTPFAVGSAFDYQFKVSADKVSAGQPIIIYQTLSGLGNMQQELLDAVLLGEKKCQIKDSHHSHTIINNQFTGFQSRSYEVFLDHKGFQLITIPSFQYLDVTTGRIKNIKGKKIQLEWVNAKELIQTESRSTRLPFKPVEVDLEAKPSNFFKAFINYILFLPALIIFLIIFIFYIKKRKKIKTQLLAAILFFSIFSLSAENKTLSSLSSRNERLQRQLHEAENAFSLGSYSESLALYQQLIIERDQCASLYYNGALSAYFLEKKGLAVFYSLKALTLYPEKGLYRRLALFLEKEYKLDHQYSILPPLNSDILFLVFAALINIVAIVLLVMLFIKQKRVMIIVLSFLLLGLLVEGALFGGSLYFKSKVPVVAKEACILHKIHSIESEPVYTVTEGSTVKVLGRWHSFVLVRTSLGFDGWVHSDELYFINKSSTSTN